MEIGLLCLRRTKYIKNQLEIKMTVTYQNDSSVFELIPVPGVVSGVREIDNWFDTHAPQGSLFKNPTADAHFLGIGERKTANPSHKFIAVVTKPWRRIHDSYNELKLMKAAGQSFPMIDQINLTSFEAFVNQLPNLVTDNTWQFSWGPRTPQTAWVSGTATINGIATPVTADYVFKQEQRGADFNPIMDYFGTNTEVSFPWLVTYREAYTDSMKNTIDGLFQTDIDAFGFVF